MSSLSTSHSTVTPDNTSTSAHPPSNSADPTLTSTDDASQSRLPSAAATSPAELARLTMKLRSGLRQYPDFPSPGILFEDIMPLFASPELHENLIHALHALILQQVTSQKIDVIVGLESRGFLFAPALALRLGAAFVPVRKQGKLPGKCEQESYQKEYGADTFEMQSDAIKPGQRVVICDDILATGGTASASGKLVRRLGGDIVGFVFMMELDFLKGRDKLDAPSHTLFSGQEEQLSSAT